MKCKITIRVQNDPCEDDEKWQSAEEVIDGEMFDDESPTHIAEMLAVFLRRLMGKNKS